MSKIIIVNGPPNCGKDESVTFFKRQYGVHGFSFKTELKALTLKLFCVPEALWDSWYTRQGKELPRAELGGRSARQALIYVSEVVVKPNFGAGWFGLVEAKKLEAIQNSAGGLTAAASDGGFNSEVEPLCEIFGRDNVYILRINRPECSYEGDSRNWIDTTAVPSDNYYTVMNDGSLDRYWRNLENFYAHCGSGR